MKKIIQTLQQTLDFVDTKDRNKLQRIIRDLKTIRIRTERKVERQKDTIGCAISFFGILILILLTMIYKLWTTIVG
jgi:hypothetical protein|tara:strand:- start:1630 stop:1857 length:228 start_codon:yes stop_codon:yes gene_type:complete